MSWERKVLGDISTSIQTGPFGSQLHQSDYSDEGVPVVMPKDLIQGAVSEESIARVSKEHVERLSKHKIQDGDILYSRRGDVGKCAFTSEREIGWICGTGCLKVSVDKDKADPQFIFYQLQKAETIGWVINHAVGSTMLNLNTSILSAVPVDVPEIEIQRKIVKILSSYDELIANNQKQIKLLEEAAQRLYKEWFVDLRFPGYKDVKIVDDVPEGWRKQKISDFGEIITGKTPSTAKEQYYGGKIPFVKIPDMHDCVYPITTESTLTSEGANTQKNKFIPQNGIMVSCIATVGLVNIAVASCQTNQQINSIILNDEQDLYYTYSTMKRLKTLLEGVGSNGATMTNVNKTKFGNLEILYPTDELRKMYYDFCQPIFEKIYALSISINKLSLARDRLLPKLMNREIEIWA
ncbi:restriction endonuclease subunit S [Lachnospiraceae bacterium 62-26]|jgi:type I restriction enzyme S subunit